MNRPLGDSSSSRASSATDERYRVLVEGIAFAIWETDCTGLTILDSPSWRAFTGQTPEVTENGGWTEAIHPDDRDTALEHWNWSVQKCSVFNVEFRIRRADGEWIWTQVHAAPLRDGAGHIGRWVGMNVDISQRKQAAQQLVKNERQLKLALDISLMSFWSLDPRAGLVRMDARMRAMWGETTTDELLPLEIVMNRIHPSDRELVVESVESALQPDGAGVFLPIDYRIVLDDGAIRWLSANGMTMFSGRSTEKHAIELFGTVLDITDRKKTEDSLRDSEERLQQLNAQLEDRVRERTQDLVDSQSRLRATAEVAEQSSRQLRRLALELTRAEERERRRLAQILHDHLQQLLVGAKMRLAALAHDSEFSAAEERLVGISAVIDIAIDATRTLAVELAPPVLHSQGLPAALQWLARHIQEQHQLNIQTSLDVAANPKSEESRELLFQAARELLLNVIKHAAVQCAELILTTDVNNITLVVQDHGAGFDSPLASDDAPTFGLFHLRERAGAVGGSLEIKSQAGQGTHVSVKIPS